MQEQQATVRGVPMRWTEAGEGLPVVLVHGIPTRPALWRHVLPQVQGGRCLAFELVGYGNSIPAGRDRDISVARQADYLLGWLEQLGVQRAVLVGHDLGGGVAQVAAVREPRRCAGLVLTNSICYDSWPIPSVRAAGGQAGDRAPADAGVAGAGGVAAGPRPRRARDRPGVAGHPPGALPASRRRRRAGLAGPLAAHGRYPGRRRPAARPAGARAGGLGCCRPVPEAAVRRAAGVGPAHRALAHRGRAGTLSPRTTPRGSPTPSTRSWTPRASAERPWVVPGGEVSEFHNGRKAWPSRDAST